MFSQERIFRAVRGAVRNTKHGHPEWKLTRDMATSIAKRAAGTLTAQMRETLAAGPPASQAGLKLPLGAHAVTYEAVHTGGQGLRQDARGASTRVAIVSNGGRPRRSPLSFLHWTLGKMVKEAKVAGRAERAEALIEVLRLIAAQRVRVGTKPVN